jgi:hypothetical protein
MSCDIQAAGTIELYFYGELPLADRADIQAHVKQCPDCRQALEDLSVIRAALATRPDVATPPRGDWSPFMARLEAAIQRERDAAAQPDAGTSRRVLVMPIRRRRAPYLAMAAMLALVTISVLSVMRERPAPAPVTVANDVPRSVPTATTEPSTRVDPALVSLSGQHFQRSKLVVLGLATKDATKPGEDDWAYERELATGLLNDTRLYRLAAEERGMTGLAGVMRDLELVLLQTSMSERPDEESLEQLQRLIRRRDLLTKMDVVYAGGS